MDDEIVKLATYADPFEAEWVKEQLEEAGLRVFQAGQATNALFAGLGGAFGEVELHVRTADLGKAQAVLQSLAEEEKERLEKEDQDHESSTAIQRPNGALAPPAPETALQAAPAPREPDEGPPRDEEAAAMGDESADGPDSVDVTWTPDYYVERAYRAALYGAVTVFGIFIFQPYSVWLLFRLLFADGELSPGRMRKLLATILIDALALIPLLWGVLVFIGLFRR